MTPMRFVANSPIWLRTMESIWTAMKARLRAILRVRELRCLRLSKKLSSSRIVLICTVWNEAIRLPFFFEYYRSKGVESFIVIDNGSTDGSREFASLQHDTSLFAATGSFKKSRFGVDWVNHILSIYCHNKWILFVDADELLVFANCDKRTVVDLIGTLERMKCSSLPCMMLDMYSDRSVADNLYKVGQDPLEVCDLFDESGYTRVCNRDTRTTWIKGGVRARNFFKKEEEAPALNKTPLVKWRRHYSFIKSQHELWPPHLNSHHHGFDLVTGCLLHFKFLSILCGKLAEESIRGQHTQEYEAYRCIYDQAEQREPLLRGTTTRKFRGWWSLVAGRIITPIDWTILEDIQNNEDIKTVSKSEKEDLLTRDADSARIIGGRAFQ